VIVRLPTGPSLVSRIVAPYRHEQERLLTEQEGPAAIARFEAMFEARVAPFIPPPPVAVAVETSSLVPSLRTVPSRRGNASAGAKVCPDCLQSVLKSARSCAFCRYDFELAESAWPIAAAAG